MKDLYFPGVKKPDLSKEYDVVGFDADHCIVKYNIEALSRLMLLGLGEDMVENGGYPVEISQLDDNLLGFVLNNSVWDIENNTLLELLDGKVISTAFKGTS